MLNYQEKWVDTLGGKPRNVFVPWIRDHVHVMKAMKYIHEDMTSFIEFFLQNQTAEGLYFDYYFPLKYGGSGDRKNIFHQRYWKVFPGDSIEMHRLPVEADLEYLLVEGVYAVWQSTADTTFIRKWLPSLVKGINYSMTDPLRWSKKHQLVKRGYTLDTWDFMQLPTNRQEYTKNGGNVQKGIFDIDDHTLWALCMATIAACMLPATSFRLYMQLSAIRPQPLNGKKRSAISEQEQMRFAGTEKFTHFVPDDPPPPYLTMDQRNTLSLSNPYDINRGLPTESMSQSIIKTYEALKESNKKIHLPGMVRYIPAVQPHFADYCRGPT